MNQILDKFAKLPLPVKLVVLLVIILAMGGAEWQFFISPKKAELETVVRQKGELNLRLQENQAVADNLPTFQEEVNVLNEQLKQAVSLLPNEADIHAILRQLSILSRKTNVELSSFRPGQTSSRGFYNEINMDLKLEGTYNDLAIFLDQIGKLNRIINVYDIQFDPPKQEGRLIKTGIQCKASTFMFRGGT